MPQNAGGRDDVRDIRLTLHEEIASGRLCPGGELAVTRIAGRHHKSAATVREAVRILVGEGVLTERSGRGFWIPILQPGDLRDYFRASGLIASALAPIVSRQDPCAVFPNDSGETGAEVMTIPSALCRLAHVPGLEAALRPIDAALLPYRRAERGCFPDWTTERATILEYAQAGDVGGLRLALARWHRRRIAVAETLVTMTLRG